MTVVDHSFLFSYSFPGLGGLGGNLGLGDICSKRTTANYPNSQTIPESFDSRTKWSGCISPIRDQVGLN